MTIGQIDLKHVVSHCEAESERHRQLSVQNSQPAMRGMKNEKLADEYAAMSNMAAQLGTYFLSLEDGAPPTKEEIDVRARKIDPTTFANHAKMIERLVAQGSPPAVANEAADAAYGDLISRLHREAFHLLTAEKARDEIEDDFEKGFRAAIQWHERRARESERDCVAATDKILKRRYAVRAKRHLFFAQELKAELNTQPEKVQDRSQSELPFAPPPLSNGSTGKVSIPKAPSEDHIPLEVLMAYRKKSEAFDDEGWT